LLCNFQNIKKQIVKFFSSSHLIHILACTNMKLHYYSPMSCARDLHGFVNELLVWFAWVCQKSTSSNPIKGRVVIYGKGVVMIKCWLVLGFRQVQVQVIGQVLGSPSPLQPQRFQVFFRIIIEIIELGNWPLSKIELELEPGVLPPFKKS
jgi:hypothetical protein